MSKKITLTKDQTLQLIKEIERRPCLWNQNDKEYFKRQPVARAWKEICIAMDNLSELDVKTKWKSLRDTYRKELKKTDNDHTSKWQYFDKLNFVEFKSQGTEKEEAQMETDDDENEQECEVQLDSLGQSEETYWAENPIPEKKIKEDEFDVMFLKSLTPYLRELGPMRKLVIRSKLQDMLLNELAAQNATRRSTNS